MSLSEPEILGRLGDGVTIEAVCKAAQITRTEFDTLWNESTRRRVLAENSTITEGVSAPVKVQRDKLGIPHIFAANDRDLFFAYGAAMAQDRLFQLDWLRRKGAGRLAEIIGTDGLESDTVSRTVGINRIAVEEWERLDAPTKEIVQSFSDGINAHINDCKENLPIEFDLLRYQPETWSPVDCLVIEGEFRWYLTGRFPIICMPELARRRLGDGALYDEYLLGGLDDESILHAGDYEADKATNTALESIGQSMADPDASTGSNNWVIAADRTANKAPLVASDPHIAFEAVSCWYEAHLSGGSFNVTGMSYVGMPAIMFGRNKKVAWGITNNICSLRDLYLERTSEEHPGCFEYDGQWEPARELIEQIDVRGADSISKKIQFSRNGPLVSEILPAPANDLGPVSLKWVGMFGGGWLTALLKMDQANNVAELHEAMKPWHVPTFSLVLADVDGEIGFRASGRIPVRTRNESGFRQGWDPADQWQGMIPFEEMPAFDNPERGWIASANNRIAPNDFPHRMFGCWVSGARATRIRELIGDNRQLTHNDMRDIQMDAKNLRAEASVPGLIARLESTQTESNLFQEAIEFLRGWNFHSEPESVATTIFNVFYSGWCKTLSGARFESGAEADLMAKGVEPVAARLIAADPNEWFPNGDHQQELERTFNEALAFLEDRFGATMSDWTWGKLHVMPLKHVLSNRGDLAELLNHGGAGVKGDMLTVCNTGSGVNWTAASGGGYRMIADLSTSTLHAVDGQSQSGQQGSEHYSDQYEDWLSGQYHQINLADTPDLA
jgi:penicillin G amidase